MSTEPVPESGTSGCGLAVAGAGVLLALSGLAFWIGFFVLDPPNYVMVFAALPVSAFFTVLGAVLSTGSSDLLLAWPVDLGLWLGVGFVVSRWATRRGLDARAYATVFLVVIGVALVYGLVLSLLVEPAG